MYDDNLEQIIQVLDLMSQPVFLLDDNYVIYRNPLASALLPDAEFEQLIPNPGLVENGKIRQNLVIDDKTYNATVTKTQWGFLCVLQPDAETANLPMSYLNMVSGMIREPLGEMMTSAKELIPDAIESDPEGAAAQAASKIYRNLYRLRRIAAQLSEGSRLLLENAQPKTRLTDLHSFFREIVKPVEDILAYQKIKFRYVGMNSYCFSYIDRDMVEKAMWNLLANAVEHSKPGQTVILFVNRDRKFFYLHVDNENNEPEGVLEKTAFASFRHEPSPKSSDMKPGLGLAIARKVAQLHEGTTMVGIDEGRVRVTMTLRIREPDKTIFRVEEPVIIVPEMSPGHRALMELADALPNEAFHPYDIED